MTRTLLLLLTLVFLGSCYRVRVSDTIDPRVSYQMQDRHFAGLQSAFPPLGSEERQTDWGREMLIGRAFAEELDLYRAVSTYKRGLILVPSSNTERKLEIQYDILLCYYLGKRYDEAVDSFDKSGLGSVDKTFPAYHDLLLILYECYRELDWPEKEERIYELMQKSFPETAEKIRVSRALRTGDLAEVNCINQSLPHPSYLDQMLSCYEAQKKSVGKAQTFNALLPGAGYLYLGQKTSAFTAFLLNGLFIAAAYEFFHHGHTAAGIITTLFESGWYFGGIYGAGLEAKRYNEHIYECNAAQVLNEYNLFPVLMMQYAF